MTQYLLSVHHDENGPDLSDDEMQQVFAQVDAFNQELIGRRQLGLRRRPEPPVDRDGRRRDRRAR